MNCKYHNNIRYCVIMIYPLITLIQDYSYDKMSMVVSYYHTCVNYAQDHVYIQEYSFNYGHTHRYYNYRQLPKTPYISIAGLHVVDGVPEVRYTGHDLPKRYIYSNISINSSNTKLPIQQDIRYYSKLLSGVLL